MMITHCLIAWASYRNLVLQGFSEALMSELFSPKQLRHFDDR